MNKALAFILTPYNKNSIAALTGVLETDPRTEALPLHFVRTRGDWVRRVARLARNHERLIVALSLATSNAPAVAQELARLRTLDLPGVTVIAGGPHPSGDPPGTLDMGVDAVVVGEGEITLPALVERLLAEESIAGLPGVVTRDANGQIVHGPRPPRVDLDDYPPCGLRHRRFGPIEISRGCPWACSFCQTPFLFGGRMRHRSVEAIAAWLDLACAAGYRYARFVTLCLRFAGRQNAQSGGHRAAVVGGRPPRGPRPGVLRLVPLRGAPGERDPGDGGPGHEVRRQR